MTIISQKYWTAVLELQLPKYFKSGMIILLSQKLENLLQINLICIGQGQTLANKQLFKKK